MSDPSARFRERGARPSTGPGGAAAPAGGGRKALDSESRRDRLQPYLIDRLTDDAPGEEAEGRDGRTTTVAELRRRVLRDLEWLLNTRLRDESLTSFAGRELASASVLRYGVPDMSGRSSARLLQSSSEARRLESAVRDAIRAFEPRIVPSTLRVRVVAVDAAPKEDEKKGLTVREGEVLLEIRGDMFCQPANQPLLVQTTVDLSIGKCEVREA